MKKLFSFGLLATLCLSGCSSAQTVSEQPSDTASTSSSSTPSSSASRSSTPTATNSPSETPVKAITPVPTATGSDVQNTIFSGTTQKGNDITFMIFPPEQQEQLNDSVAGSGMKGSWATLCSNKATLNQLVETGVISTENSGTASYLWRSVNYAVKEDSTFTPQDANIAIQILNDIAASQSESMKCVSLNSGSEAAAAQGYASVTVGRYMGTAELQETSTIY